MITLIIYETLNQVSAEPHFIFILIKGLIAGGLPCMGFGGASQTTLLLKKYTVAGSHYPISRQIRIPEVNGCLFNHYPFELGISWVISLHFNLLPILPPSCFGAIKAVSLCHFSNIHEGDIP